jgi:outer membrane receptor for ferrienterochelin and colicins
MKSKPWHESFQTIKKQSLSITIKLEVNFDLTNFQNDLNEVVVTGTKNQTKTESPVIVNYLNSKMLDNLQVCNLSEGLKFQPGLE